MSSLVLNGLFVLLIGVVVAAAAAIRPRRAGDAGDGRAVAAADFAGGSDGVEDPSRTTTGGTTLAPGRSRWLPLTIWFAVGLVIGLVLLSTNTLYRSGKW